MTLLIALLACKQNPEDTHVVDTGDFESSVCGLASADFGSVVCLHRLDAPEDLELLAVVGSGDVLLETRYFVPQSDPPVLPALFANSNALPDDPAFLTTAFPDRFPALDAAGFEALVTGEGRQLATGAIGLRIDADTGAEILGFTVRESTPLTLDEVTDVWRQLRDQIGDGVPVFVPEGDQIARAAGWEASFPIAAPAVPDDELYVPGVGYGTLRAWSSAELDQAELDRAYGAGDVLVLEDAPFGLDGVAGGVVSSSLLPVLAPTNLRAAAHGVPSCYARAAFDDLAALAGTTVRVECTVDGVVVEPATPADAEAHVEGLRPAPVTVDPPELTEPDLVPLADIPVSTAAERAHSRSVYGAQAVDLALATQQLGLGGALRGFSIPVAWYDDFIDRNTFAAEVGGTISVVTYREALDAWAADPAFLSDPAVRAARLRTLSAAMLEGQVHPLLPVALEVHLLAAFGGTGITARYRTSATGDHVLGLAVDGAEQASSGCLADDLDGDLTGPSICDPDQVDERTAIAAIAAVYAEHWSVEAVEERLWRGLPLFSTMPAVLVVERTSGERADIRAFTVDPLSGAPGALVHAQLGEQGAVDRDPDVHAEVSRLVLDGGAVTSITRESASTEADGAPVLSDAQLETLGARLAQLQAGAGFDLAVPAGQSVQLDTGWKVLLDGRLVLKSVRVFTR
ncbi:MAG: hypothetical protein R3F61_18495 [Myxococcota bacterium]